MMIIPLNRQFPAARVLVLLALLVFAGLQAGEGLHWHEAEQSQAQCLFCEASADIPLPVSASRGGLQPVSLPCAVWRDINLLPAPYFLFSSRGPPVFS